MTNLKKKITINMNFPQAISAASSTALELGTLKPTDTKVVLETVGEVDVVIRIFTHQKAKVCDTVSVVSCLDFSIWVQHPHHGSDGHHH